MAISSGRPRIWRPDQDITLLPDEWALYRIAEQSGALHYIGITSKLRTRVRQHHRTGNFDPVAHHLQFQLASKGVTWDELMAWERRKIRDHQPTGVTYAGGNGRRPMVQVNGAALSVDPGESVEDAMERHGLLARFVSLFRS